MISFVIDDLEVHAESPAKLKVEIRDRQPGSHLWTGGIHPEEFPTDDPQWETYLFFDEELSYIEFVSTVINQNPASNKVSLYIEINGQEISDDRLQMEVEDNELVEFTVVLNFICEKA